MIPKETIKEKIQFPSNKQKLSWLKLKIQEFQNNISNPRLIAQIINARESVVKKNGDKSKLTEENVMEALDNIDSESSNYKISDPSRTSMELKELIIDTSNLTQTQILIYEAGIMEACSLVFNDNGGGQFYFELHERANEADIDIGEEIGIERQQFKEETKKILIVILRHMTNPVKNDLPSKIQDALNASKFSKDINWPGLCIDPSRIDDLYYYRLNKGFSAYLKEDLKPMVDNYFLKVLNKNTKVNSSKDPEDKVLKEDPKNESLRTRIKTLNGVHERIHKFISDFDSQQQLTKTEDDIGSLLRTIYKEVGKILTNRKDQYAWYNFFGEKKEQNSLENIQKNIKENYETFVGRAFPDKLDQSSPPKPT